VALNFTAVNGESIDRPQLIARLTGALQIDDAAADAVIAELVAEGLLQTESESAVGFSDPGRERYARTRDAIDKTTAPLFADIPADDEATTRRVLTTIAERADTQLARA
jgi:DNA-binding MarR family transcriptional regulator